MIQEYLNGKTRDQIAIDIGISQGTVSGIIKEWATGIGMPNAEYVRGFAVILNKSGISAKQCAEGYRIVKLLRSLGIDCESDGYGSEDIKNNSDANKVVISLLEGIYMNCKRLGISPSTIFLWIKDLLDFFPSIHNNNNNNLLTSLTCTDNGEYQDKHMENGELGHQEHQWSDTDKHHI